MKSFNVVSPANIAFIKYWGNRDAKLVLPNSDTFSMNLSNCFTTIELELRDNPSDKTLMIKRQHSEYERANEESLRRLIKYYDTFREYFKLKKDVGFRIRSESNFPIKSGIASSSSFFSGMALAFSEALGINLDEKRLSIAARLGSGSACRSVPDGFVWWHKGEDSESSFSESIAAPNYWDILDIVAVVSSKEKATTSKSGHTTAPTSPFYRGRLKDLEVTTREIRKAFEAKDFTKFGQLSQDEAVSLHAVIMTQQPPIYYWNGASIEIMRELATLRMNGIEAYFTFDAGANPHIICESASEEKIVKYFSNHPNIEELIVNRPARGTHLIS